MSILPPYVESSDTVIISDILYYISNKLHNTPVTTVVTTCHSFYTDNDYVFGEKKKLCDATQELCSARRNDNKRLNNIEDICSILTRRDSQNLFVPKFVSLQLSNVPTNEAGDPSLGQIMAAIVNIQRNMVTKEMLKSTVNDLKVASSSSSPAAAADAATISSSSLSAAAALLPSSLSAEVSLQPPPLAPTSISNVSASGALSPSAPAFNLTAAEGHVNGRSRGGSHQSRGGGGGRGRGGGGRGGDNQ